MACVFMPNANIVSTNERAYIHGAMKYLKYEVKRHKYVFYGKIQVPQCPLTTVPDRGQNCECPEHDDDISKIFEEPITDKRRDTLKRKLNTTDAEQTTKRVKRTEN